MSTNVRHKKKKSSFLKRTLVTAFTTATLGTCFLPSPIAHVHQPENDNAPETITLAHTFNKRMRKVNLADPRWTDMQAHTAGLVQNPQYAQLMNDLVRELDDVRNASLHEKAKAVNGAINDRIEYAFDKDLYGKDEFWVGPVETLLYKKADCEDFAILKYYTLRALGVPENNLYLALVNRDRTSNEHNHAILIINDAQQGTHFVTLDNDGQEKVKGVQNTGYPFFAMMNTKGYWAPEGEAGPSIGPPAKTYSMDWLPVLLIAGIPLGFIGFTKAVEKLESYRSSRHYSRKYGY